MLKIYRSIYDASKDTKFLENKLDNVCEYGLYRPLGQKLGMKEQRKRVPAPKELTSKQSGAMEHDEERSLERWLRQKKLLGRPSKLDKFSETGWRWLYYTNIFGFGLVSGFLN